MNKKKMTLLLVPVGLVVLAGLTACVPFWGPGGGMMGPRQPGQPSPGQSDNQPYPYGPGGMMGPGMMEPGGMTGGMGGMTGYYSEVPTPLSHDDARDIAAGYLASLNNPDLELADFKEYSHNFYVSLLEKSTGRGAIEIIIDRYYGGYQPEPQSMMWNRKYGMMGGSQAAMPVTEQQALEIAQDFLDIAYPGTAADEIIAYYGYYTVMTEMEDRHYGMLSVNGYSEDVWYHTWHGMFIAELEGHG